MLVTMATLLQLEGVDKRAFTPSNRQVGYVIFIERIEIINVGL